MERMLERILLITTSTIAFSGQLAAQAYAELDINDIKARFYSHGLIGADLGLGDPSVRGACRTGDTRPTPPACGWGLPGQPAPCGSCQVRRHRGRGLLAGSA